MEKEIPLVYLLVVVSNHGHVKTKMNSLIHELKVIDNVWSNHIYFAT